MPYTNAVYQRCFMLSLKNFKTNVNLQNYCTIHIGGNAEYLYEAQDTDKLKQAYKLCKLHNIRYKVIGLGANLIFNDLGFDGAIIVNRTNKITRRKNHLYIDSGTPISMVVNYCYLHGLSGLENLAGIPSTLGGGIVNNLGANTCEIGNFIDYIICINNNGKIIKINKNKCNFSYRNSVFKTNNFIILKAKLNLNYDEKEQIKQRIIANINKKINSQPMNLPSAGSVFKRGAIIPSLEIDKLGLKGTKIGGAMISTKHAGFIVNTGNATSKNVLDLINLIKEKVKSCLSAELELEVEFVD